MAKELKKGDRSPDVKKLQNQLNEAGAKPKLKPDGHFGPATEEALKAFQKQNKLKTDGVARRDTMQKLDKGPSACSDSRGASGKVNDATLLNGVDSNLRKAIYAFAAKFGDITISDGKRSISDQAKLMAPMSDKDLNMYGKGKAPYVVEIKKLDKKERTVKKVEEILTKWTTAPNHCYISRHLAGKAVDISAKGSFDWKKAIKVAAEVGLKQNDDPAEKDRNCFHVTLK
jgi:peptidoglycan hydrolase-like protein with peptidoglycan-binding domain